MEPKLYRMFIKRALDICLSFMAIIMLSPLFAVIALVVLIFMGRPVLFCQERIGKDEKPFMLCKFRSMASAKNEDANLLSEKERTTKIGSMLRSSSLDELPELFSILLGKMSFVGPRPMPTFYGPHFLPKERKRHKIRGGLIPPDSLSGKTYTTYEEQFRYECDYVDNVSFMLDCKVIVMTLKILVDRVRTNYGIEFERAHLDAHRGHIRSETEEKSL